jgi:dTDP-4-dehydrorhamnose reductase
MRKVWVTGSNGQVGKALCRLLQSQKDLKVYCSDRTETDLTDIEAVDRFIEQNAIDTIVNCAAYTAVDKAESDEAAAYAVNRDAVAHLAAKAKRHGIWLIHLSTDYVFGECYCRPINEEVAVAPRGVYARSKYEGEKAIRDSAPEHALIIRTSWVYALDGHNFVKTMRRLGRERDTIGVVCDQIGTPTYAEDIASMLVTVLQRGKKILPFEPTLYHFSNEGCASWYDFAKAIFEFSDIDCHVEPIPTEAYPTPAERPAYSLLDKSKIKRDYALQIPYWRDSLRECIAKLDATE